MARKSKKELDLVKSIDDTKKLKEELAKEAKNLLAKAEELGPEKKYLFSTTFQRYQKQMSILENLEPYLDEPIVTKEYVKGRENIYVNPAVKMYEQMGDSMNKTVTVLDKIMQDLGSGDSKQSKPDPLLKLFDGGGAK